MVREFKNEPGDIIIKQVIDEVLLHVGSNSKNGLDSLVENWNEPDEQNAGDDLTMVVLRSHQ